MPSSNSAPSSPRRGSLLGVFCLTAALGSAFPPPVPPEPALLPLPAEVNLGPGALVLSEGFTLEWQGPGEERLRLAAERFVERLRQRTGLTLSQALRKGGKGPGLKLVSEKASLPLPQLGEDESYLLEVSAQGAQLKAPTTLGILRGLETLQQLLVPLADKGAYALREARIQDAPRFPWRGLMLDVCRHWLPKEVVLRQLEGMAQVKLNVLHLHLSEDQGFRVESLSHPELHQQGSDGQYLRQTEIKEIVAKAALLGIRVVPEFDVPGHATSWLVSHPELGSAPGPYHLQRRWGIFDPVLDPSNEAVYALLGDVFKEMAALFPDPYFHIGGDENNGVHWSANPRLQAFIQERGLGNNEGLHTYFNTRLAEILAGLGKRLVGWDEILQPGLPTSAVIHSWRGTEALAQAARKGYSGLLSNGYYIDLNQPASEHYLADPLPEGNTLSAEERARVLGGEATMWSEWVNPETVDSRIWPRTAAIAERLWSPQTVRDLDSLYARLEHCSARLHETGFRHRAYLEKALQELLDRPEPPERMAQLRAFVELVEPVKQYQRNHHQFWFNQLHPLTQLADAARPDSAPARGFSRNTERLLAGARPLAPAALQELETQLLTWRELGYELGWNLGMRHAKLVDGAELARALVRACTVGLEALEALKTGTLKDLVWFEKAKLALDEAAKTNGSAVELPFIPALRALSESAAAQKPGSSKPKTP